MYPQKNKRVVGNNICGLPCFSHHQHHVINVEKNLAQMLHAQDLRFRTSWVRIYSIEIFLSLLERKTGGGGGT